MYHWCSRLNKRRSISHQYIWCWLSFTIQLFWFLDTMSCCEDLNLERSYLMFLVWMTTFIIHIWWILHLVLQTWMLSRSCGKTCRVPLLRVFIFMGKLLGPSPVVYLLKIMWGWKSVIPHPITKAHIFDVDPLQKIKKCRKHVYHSTKGPKWLKLIPNNKIGLSRWSFILF